MTFIYLPYTNEGERKRERRIKLNLLNRLVLERLNDYIDYTWGIIYTKEKL